MVRSAGLRKLTQKSSTDNTGIVAQLCNTNVSLLIVVLGIAFFLHNLHKRSYEVVALFAYSAADTKNIRLKNIYNINNSCCEVADIFLNNSRTNLIALLTSPFTDLSINDWSGFSFSIASLVRLIRPVAEA